MGRSRSRLTGDDAQRDRRLGRKFVSSLALALGLSIGTGGLLGGCATGVVVDDLPAGVGLPADAPARPKVAYQYPAVHDMPPPRATEPLSDAAQVRLEKELQSDRDRLEGKPVPAKKRAAAAKKRPEAANSQPLNIKSDQGSGAATKP